jgi:hypothetical protein
MFQFKYVSLRNSYTTYTVALVGGRDGNTAQMSRPRCIATDIRWGNNSWPRRLYLSLSYLACHSSVYFFKCKEPAYKAARMSLSLCNLLIITVKLAEGHHAGTCRTGIIAAPGADVTVSDILTLLPSSVHHEDSFSALASRRALCVDAGRRFHELFPHLVRREKRSCHVFDPSQHMDSGNETTQFAQHLID